MQLVFAICTEILIVEIESLQGHKKRKPLARWFDQVRSGSIVDLMVYVTECFNLPIPDEAGLLYKLKAIGLKVGK